MDADRVSLIRRQGLGARYDAPEAPVDNLLFARRTTAAFRRYLNALPDEAFVDKCRVPGEMRSHIVAHIGYHARGLTRLLEALRTGNGIPEHVNEQARRREVMLGASLPPRALRGLFDHSAIHLDVAWRDLPGSLWEKPLIRWNGDQITARDMPRLRALAIRRAAFDLDVGARDEDFPDGL